MTYEEYLIAYETFVKEQERMAEHIETEADYQNSIPLQSFVKFLRGQIDDFSHLRDGNWIDPDAEENEKFEDELDDELHDKDLFSQIEKGDNESGDIEEEPPQNPQEEDIPPEEDKEDDNTEFPE